MRVWILIWSYCAESIVDSIDPGLENELLACRMLNDRLQTWKNQCDFEIAEQNWQDNSTSLRLISTIFSNMCIEQTSLNLQKNSLYCLETHVIFPLFVSIHYFNHVLSTKCHFNFDIKMVGLVFCYPSLPPWDTAVPLVFNSEPASRLFLLDHRGLRPMADIFSVRSIR